MADFCWRCGKALDPGSQQCLACGALAARAAELRLDLPAPDPTQAFPLDFPLPVAEDVGRIMDHGWKLYRRHFWMLARINLLIWLPVYLTEHLVIYGLGLQDELALGFAIAFLEAVLFGALTGPVQVYAILDAMRTGTEPPLRAAFYWGALRWPRLILYGGLVALLSSMGLAFLLVPGVVIWIVFAFVNEVVAVEAPGTPPLVRSRQLTSGIRLRLFGAVVIAGMLLAAVLMALGMPFHLTGSVNAIDNWWASTIFDALGTLAYPFLSCILLVAYLDARRREALPGSLNRIPHV